MTNRKKKGNLTIGRKFPETGRVLSFQLLFTGEAEQFIGGKSEEKGDSGKVVRSVELQLVVTTECEQILRGGKGRTSNGKKKNRPLDRRVTVCATVAV